ncbi:hypothetical protein PHMEG_00018814 [Phytophthora megakarya]|uniref:Uncharacterized protein n=1 Tax=Phytophthora megakarya TaxID=4795 RepID=A0A225VUM2_9STRA|nr:hypothetical protein PHMEG_00018814 [Phytophthora megakarya]
MHSVADSTLTKYSAAMNKWTVWGSCRGIEPWLYNLIDESCIQMLSDFIAHGFQYGFGAGRPLRRTSIINTFQRIRHFFAAAGRVISMAYPHVRMLLKGIPRLDTPPRHKAPVSIPLLETCIRSLRLDDPFAQALWGSRSEIVSISGNSFKWFALRAEDLVALDISGDLTLSAAAARSVHMRLRGSKTNQARFLVCNFRGFAYSMVKTGPFSRNPSGGILEADRPADVHFNDTPVDCNQEGCRTKWR